MGHGAGDAVLMEAGRRLAEAARAEDTVARFGGDEFTILCENAGEAEVRVVAERVLAAFASPFEHDGREFHLSASIGVRISDLACASPDLMLRDADIALYAAKAHGRGRYELYDPDARTDAVDLLATEQALRLALRHNEFCVHYQPRRPRDCTDHRLRGAPALAAPRARPHPPGRLHPRRRGERPDRPDRRVGPPRGVLQLPRWRQRWDRARRARRGERLRAPALAAGAAKNGRVGARASGARSGCPLPRDHRERDHPRPGDRACEPRRDQGAGRVNCAR